MLAFAVIGATIGFCVLFVYATQRAALPEFSGDEWLPQIVKLGVFCGVLVALLMLAPLTDVFMYRGLVNEAPRRPLLSTLNLAYALRQATLLAGVGIAFVALILYRTEPPLQWMGPVSMLACALLAGVLGYVTVHQLFRRKDLRAARWYQGLIHAPMSLIVFLVTLLSLVLLVASRWQPSTNPQVLLLATGLALLLAILQTVVFIALQSVQRIGTRLLVATGIVLATATGFAPEAVRLAGLGNLPHARLLMERPLACTVSRHLVLKEWSTSCVNSAATNGDGPVVLDLDVVLRVGSHYTVAAPGALVARSQGSCAPAHHADEAAASERSEKRFSCADIPRDAIKLIRR